MADIYRIDPVSLPERFMSGGESFRVFFDIMKVWLSGNFSGTFNYSYNINITSWL